MYGEIREMAVLIGAISLLCIAANTQARARPRPDLFCIFHGKKYSAGDSWHPYLEPQGVVYCIRCMCSEGGVSCYKIKCPVLQCIHTVTDPQQCCPRCVETPSGLRAPPKMCQHNGTTYQQGEMFTTHELFPTRQSNQCVQCSCSDGQIYCGLVTCPELVCSSPMTVPDSCCPVCRDGSFERSGEEEPLNRGVRHSQDQCLSELLSKKSLGATESTIVSSSLGFNPRSFKQKGGGGTTVKILMKEKHKKACIYNGKTYSHGEVWHPVFRNFGAIPCILCTCKDGSQDCQRVTCPEEYPCDYPEKVEGKCCKVCQDDKVEPTEEVTTTRCLKNPNKILVYMYMSPTTAKQKENLRKIAIEKEASEDVEIYVWKMVKGIFHLIQIKKVAKQDFRQEAEHFRLVTRTSEGQWNIFRPQPPELNITEISEMQSEAL
ncbi:chordin-like protein 2 [Rana temporaria]|uniref:chordin-like protein 2 n=1 Tax=Rana temporaria TaxID=8407 RepID=UPI001AACE05A|nr:chordin-like protein 2 [Rana temporaria]